MGPYIPPTIELIRKAGGLPPESSGWYFTDVQTGQLLDALHLHSVNLRAGEKIDSQTQDRIRLLIQINAALEWLADWGLPVADWLEKPNSDFDDMTPFEMMLQSDDALKSVHGSLVDHINELKPPASGT